MVTSVTTKVSHKLTLHVQPLSHSKWLPLYLKANKEQYRWQFLHRTVNFQMHDTLVPFYALINIGRDKFQMQAIHLN